MNVDIPINLENTCLESAHPQQHQDTPFLCRSQSIKQRNPEYRSRRRLPPSNFPQPPRRRGSLAKQEGSSSFDSHDTMAEITTSSSNANKSATITDRPVLQRVHSISFDQRRRKTKSLNHRTSLRRSRSLKHSRRRRRRPSRRQCPKILSFVGSDAIMMECDVWIECIWFRRRKSLKTYFKSIHTQKCFKQPPTGAKTIIYLEDCIESEEELTHPDDDSSDIEHEECKDETSDVNENDSFQQASKKKKKGKMHRIKKKWKALVQLVPLGSKRSTR
jgi:hypothetical protein